MNYSSKPTLIQPNFASTRRKRDRKNVTLNKDCSRKPVRRIITPYKNITIKDPLHSYDSMKFQAV